MSSHEPTSVPRAAIYLRVSTSNGRQTTENQRLKLEELARVRGYEPVPFEDHRSAVKHRPGLEAMMNAARRGEVQVVLVAALDRLGRSMTGVVQIVLDLERAKVPVISLREPWLDTGGPARDLLLAIFGWVAQEERRILVARTHDGLDRARAQGKRLGRPRVLVDVGRAVQLRREGTSMREVAKMLGVGVGTLTRALRQAARDGVPETGSTPGVAA
jgi:putative DNA-invertase from lambdoid prophage Rac